MDELAENLSHLGSNDTAFQILELQARIYAFSGLKLEEKREAIQKLIEKSKKFTNSISSNYSKYRQRALLEMRLLSAIPQVSLEITKKSILQPAT